MTDLDQNASNSSSLSALAKENALEMLLLASLKEQKSQRRWKIFFRFFYLTLFLLIILAFYLANSTASTHEKSKKAHGISHLNRRNCPR